MPNRRLRSSNVQERANPGLKCRSRVVKVFPPGRSLVRMLDAVLSGMDEDWAAKRWFAEDSIALAASPTEVAAPAVSYDGALPRNTPGRS